MAHCTFDDPHGTSLQARQALLDNRCEHKPKRHRTLGRRKRMSAEKKRKIKAKNALRLVAFRRWKAKVRAYWNGDADDHPPSPQ